MFISSALHHWIATKYATHSGQTLPQTTKYSAYYKSNWKYCPWATLQTETKVENRPQREATSLKKTVHKRRQSMKQAGARRPVWLSCLQLSTKQNLPKIWKEFKNECLKLNALSLGIAWRFLNMVHEQNISKPSVICHLINRTWATTFLGFYIENLATHL